MESHPEILNAVVQEITKRLSSRSAIIFCGAGISRDSGLPVVNQLVPYLLEKLKIPSADLKYLLDEENYPRIPFEMIMEDLQKLCKIEKLLDIYDQGTPNTNHIFLAGLLKTAVIKTIVTTNFDRLIEKALESEPGPMLSGKDFEVIIKEEDLDKINWNDNQPRLVKIHGCICDKSSMAITLNKIARNDLSGPRLSAMDHIFSSGGKDSVLVLGYSCSDVFDISPGIERIIQDRKDICFIQHAAINKIEDIGEKGSKNPFTAFHGIRCYCDTSELVKNLWLTCTPGALPYKKQYSEVDWRSLVDSWYEEVKRKSAGLINYSFPALYFLRLGLYRPASGYLKRSMELAAKEPMLIPLLVEALGEAHFFSGDFKEAIACYRELLDNLTFPPAAKKIEAIILTNLGVAYRNCGDYQQAKYSFQKALKIGKETRDPDILSRSYGNLGNVNRNMGQFEKAMQNFNRTMDLAVETGDIAGQVLTLVNLGNIFDVLGNTEKMIECNERALRLAKETGDERGVGLITCQIGLTFKNKGDYQRANEYFREALAIARKIDNSQNEVVCLGNMGMSFLKLGMPAEAILHCEQGLHLSRQIGDPEGERLCLMDMGAINFEAKNFESAIVFYREALQLASIAGDRSILGLCYFNIGHCYYQIKEYNNAKECYKYASRAFRKVFRNGHSARKEAYDTIWEIRIRKLQAIPIFLFGKILGDSFLKYASPELIEAYCEAKAYWK